MDSQASNPAIPKSRLIPLSEHPQMDRLAEILTGLSPDRKQAFDEWLNNHGEDVPNGGNDE